MCGALLVTLGGVECGVHVVAVSVSVFSCLFLSALVFFYSPAT